jgi:hypothetical protein
MGRPLYEHPERIVPAYRAARARLKLGGYERYLVEHIAARVAWLLGKRDEAERAGDGAGDAHEAGGRALQAPDSHAGAPANNPPV